MSTKSGKRVVVQALGEDPLSSLRENLAIEEQPAPDVASLGARDVLVRVRAAAVGWVDLLMTSGQYQKIPTPPYTPGLEYAGEVLWVGDAVASCAVGDGVLADATKTGPRSTSAYERWGGFATYAVAPAEALAPVPAALSFAEAAGLLGGYETAYHALVHRGRLAGGETVLVHGASGVTGLAAVHVAKAVGATVIATGRSADKLGVVSEEGADHVLDTSAGGDEPPRFRDEVKALTGGRGVDVVYDPVGGPVSLESLRCVSFGARFLVVGWASTPLAAKGKGGRGAPRPNLLPTNLMMMKGLDVLGCPAVISAQKDPSLVPKRRRWIAAQLEAGRFRPRVAKRYPLDQVTDALLDKWNNVHVGNLVLQP